MGEMVSGIVGKDGYRCNMNFKRDIKYINWLMKEWIN